MPVINENDTTTTDEISFGDNDFLAAQVAILVGAERLLLLTNTDGVFTSDPRTDPDAELVSRIERIEELEALQITQQTSIAGLRRDALEGRRRGDGDRRRDPDRDRQRAARRHDQRGRRAARRWARPSSRAPTASRASSCG